MGFTDNFEKEKPLKESPYSLKEMMGPHELRYHPKRKRWSCGCQDWQYRRSDKPDSAPMEDRDCKHIKAKLTGKTPQEIRAHDVANNGKAKIPTKSSLWGVISGVFR